MMASNPYLGLGLVADQDPEGHISNLLRAQSVLQSVNQGGPEKVELPRIKDPDAPLYDENEDSENFVGPPSPEKQDADKSARKKKRLGTAGMVMDALHALVQIRQRDRTRKQMRQGYTQNVGPYGPMRLQYKPTQMAPMQPGPYISAKLQREDEDKKTREKRDADNQAIALREMELNAKMQNDWEMQNKRTSDRVIESAFGPQGKGNRASAVQELEYLQNQPAWQEMDPKKQMMFTEAIFGLKAPAMSPADKDRLEAMLSYTRAYEGARGRAHGKRDFGDGSGTGGTITNKMITDLVSFKAHLRKHGKPTGGLTNESYTEEEIDQMADSYIADVHSAGSDLAGKAGTSGYTPPLDLTTPTFDPAMESPAGPGVQPSWDEMPQMPEAPQAAPTPTMPQSQVQAGVDSVLSSLNNQNAIPQMGPPAPEPQHFDPNGDVTAEPGMEYQAGDLHEGVPGVPEQPTIELTDDQRLEAIANYKRAIASPPLKADGTPWTPDELAENFYKQFGFWPYDGEQSVEP